MQQCKERLSKLERQHPTQQQTNIMLIEQDSSTQFRPFCLQTHLHADFESLYKEVPKRLLPEEYGGEAGPIDVLIRECGVLLSAYANFLFKKKKTFFRHKFRSYKSET